MQTYNWFLGLSNWLMWGLCFVFFTLLASSVILLIVILRGNKYRFETSTLNNALISGMLVPTSLSIAFIANDVWRTEDKAKNIVAKEAMVAYDTLRLSHQFPNAISASFHEGILRYIDTLVHDEWYLMQEGEVSDNAEEETRALIFTVNRLLAQNHDPYVALLLKDMKANINQLIDARDDRLIVANTFVSFEKWISVLILMSVCLLVIFEIHFHKRRDILKAFVLVTLSFSTIAFVILVNDRPFVGKSSIQPTDLMLILQSKEAKSFKSNYQR